MEEKSILQKSESMLTAKKIYIEEMSFHRKTYTGEVIEFEKSNIGKEIETIGNDNYKCSLVLKMKDKADEAVLEVKVSGIFGFKSEIEEKQKNVIISKNTMAILFPYLRTQVTLLTAQPDVKAVVLPPININTLLDELEKNRE